MAKAIDKKSKKTKKEIVKEITSKEVSVEVDEVKVDPKEIRETTEEKNSKKEKYYQAIGRRKESVAIIRLYTKKSTDNLEGDYALVTVNGKDYREHFTDKNLQAIVESSLKKLKSLNRFKATVKVGGGGLSGQADAIKHGIARALIMFDQNFRKKLKKAGFLTRDSRVKERRKYGLKKARKRGQWQKR